QTCALPISASSSSDRSFLKRYSNPTLRCRMLPSILPLCVDESHHWLRCTDHQEDSGLRLQPAGQNFSCEVKAIRHSGSSYGFQVGCVWRGACAFVDFDHQINQIVDTVLYDTS